MICPRLLVVLLSCADALEQLRVRDALVFSHALELRIVGDRELIVILISILLSQEVSAEEFVELVLVHDVALVLHWSRVGSLVDQLRHDTNLFDALLKFLVAEFILVLRIIRIKLLQLFRPLSISHLLLLDLGKLDLLEHLLLSQVSILVLLVSAHEGHLPLLLALESLVHLEELPFVLGQESIDILLVHVTKDLLLLLGQLFGHHLFLLPAELIHDLVLVTLHLVLPVEHAVLPLRQLLHLTLLLVLHLGEVALFLAVRLLAELFKFFLGVALLHLKILLHLVILVHVLHHLVEHDQLFLRLSVLEHLLLLVFGLQSGFLEFFLDCGFLVGVLDFNVHASIMLIFVQAFHLILVVIFRNQIVSLSLSKNLSHWIEFLF